MSELGQSVCEAVRFLRGFFADVSKLLTVVEDAMTKAGLASPWGSSSFWYYSYSYTLPNRWMPSFVVRQYVEGTADGSKPDRNAEWYAFFDVHFAPQALGEPVAIWGISRLEGSRSVWVSLDRLLLGDRALKFLGRSTVDEWQIISDPTFHLREMKYRARPVVELCDENTVRKLVLQPLLTEIEMVRAESRSV